MYTVNLFKTNFKMKGNIKLLEKYLINNWEKKKFKKKKLYFILHDGPPYANGQIHLGHILNKILKDIIIKFKYIYGYETPYILGWDGYGLPIEIKSSEKFNKFKNKLKLQNLSNNFVKNNILIQKNNFKKLGLLTNFKKYYLTINNNNSSEELKIIRNFWKKNLIYKNFKPIYWCFMCKSNLSESEIKYKNKLSFSIITIFIYLELNKLINVFNIKKLYILGGILIWTTNPWTLISNQALSVNNEFLYLLINTTKGIFIINYKTNKNVLNNLKFKFYILNVTSGKNIINVKFLNPLFAINKFYNRSSTITPFNIKNSGTGIVHLSPAYGIEDYLIFKKNFIKFKLINVLSNKGLFYKNVPIFFNKNISKTNKILIKFLFYFNKLINLNIYIHKYMYCEKHNKFLIYKITNQWFLNIKNKNKFIKNLILNKIKFTPKISKNLFLNTILTRKNWNISRQRSWGVPLIIFEHKKSLKIYKKINKLIEILSKLIKIYNIKIWNIIKKKDIIGNKAIFYKKLYDILDVWFDSGTTHWHVLRKSYKNYLKFPANLYLEGIDQHRGWFQASFITSLLLNRKLPFKKIITHGFIINESGEKLSKSLNNYIKYNNIIKNLEIDIIRLWIASINYEKNISLSKKILNQTVDIYRKIRNIIKFILSNLSDFDKKASIKFKSIKNTDKFFLNYFILLNNKLIKLYKKNKFYLFIKKLKNFLNEDLSSFYFNFVKDNLYLNIINSFKRKSNQNILYKFLKILIILICPILTFTSEESFKILFYSKSVFDFEYLKFKINKSYKKFLIIKKLKINFYKFIDILKKKKKINSINLILNIYIKKFKYKFLKKLKNDIKLIFSISKIIINIKSKLKKNIKFLIKIIKKKKCKRCWYKKLKKKNNNICNKCFIIIFKQNIKCRL